MIARAHQPPTKSTLVEFPDSCLSGGSTGDIINGFRGDTSGGLSGDLNGETSAATAAATSAATSAVASAVASSLSSHVSVSFSLELLPLTSALAPALSCGSAISGPLHVREPNYGAVCCIFETHAKTARGVVRKLLLRAQF